jgi:aspartate aminotransferase
LTFYIYPKTPGIDDFTFVEFLEQHDTFVLPGEMFEFSGHFRICLTATEQMIERSLPTFAAAIEYARARASRSAAMSVAIAAGG